MNTAAGIEAGSRIASAMRSLHFAKYRRDTKLSHYLFRFPAKFHPPVVRCLLETYTRAGQTVLDPFCGSGTLLVEARILGRACIGVDIDPLSAFISRVKSRPISPRLLENGLAKLREKLRLKSRSPREYDQLIHTDLEPSTIPRLRSRLEIPDIPNINHWFRTYVAIDLAQIRLAILASDVPDNVRAFFLACFASIVRNVSNADPVPVSGLEVTKHMRERDRRGRRINPFELLEAKIAREIAGMEELHAVARRSPIRVLRGDARDLPDSIVAKSVDAIITSPPYNTAVDYYRRHTLEMYWLGLVESHEQRLKLAKRYVGREKIKVASWYLHWQPDSPYLKRLLSHAATIGASRERALRHYCSSMDRVLGQMARVLKPNTRAIIVVGNAKWNGRSVRATKLIEELVGDRFSVSEKLTYRTANRYMSYSRHNGADVNREYVIVLRRR